MKCRILATVVAMALAAPAWAEGSLKVLADASGLSERKVNMVLGARSSFAEYPYTYDRALKQLQAAIGRDNYHRLMNGESIAVEHQGRMHIVSLRERRTDIDTTL